MVLRRPIPSVGELGADMTFGIHVHVVGRLTPLANRQTDALHVSPFIDYVV